MISFPRLAVGVATCLAALICLAMNTRADDKDDEKAIAATQAEVLKMTSALGNAKTAEGIAKTNDVKYVMHQFKLRAKGGLGIGTKAPPEGFKDGIEFTIRHLADDGNAVIKKGFDKVAIEKIGPDLVTAAKQTQAIAEINAFYAAKVKMGAKDPKTWKMYNDIMKASAADLAAAATAKDPAALKAAASKLNASCVDCHKIFRDSD